MAPAVTAEALVEVVPALEPAVASDPSCPVGLDEVAINSITEDTKVLNKEVAAAVASGNDEFDPFGTAHASALNLAELAAAPGDALGEVELIAKDLAAAVVPGVTPVAEGPLLDQPPSVPRRQRAAR